MKIKNMNISAGGSTGDSVKTCTHENFQLYGILTTSFLLFVQFFVVLYIFFSLLFFRYLKSPNGKSSIKVFRMFRPPSYGEIHITVVSKYSRNGKKISKSISLLEVISSTRYIVEFL